MNNSLIASFMEDGKNHFFFIFNFGRSDNFIHLLLPHSGQAKKVTSKQLVHSEGIKKLTPQFKHTLMVIILLFFSLYNIGNSNYKKLSKITAGGSDFEHY